jgi:AraC-like DNA-binding protein
MKKKYNIINPLIVVVEDELIIGLDIRHILYEEGFEVINVTNYNDAIIAIENFNPSLVLVDINLKGSKDGIELGSYLLINDKIPFIYISSYYNFTTLERVKETRPHGYIVKPFKPEDLKTTVSIVLNNFKHRNIDVLRENKEITNDIPFILKHSLNYINQNINEKIKIADLAKHTKWDSQHFSRIFHQFMGVTPHKYIVQKKIEKAKVLLIETEVPIIQISFELGFGSYSNFCTTFKKATNKTPERFRKMQQVINKHLL